MSLVSTKDRTPSTDNSGLAKVFEIIQDPIHSRFLCQLIEKLFSNIIASIEITPEANAIKNRVKVQFHRSFEREIRIDYPTTLFIPEQVHFTISFCGTLSFPDTAHAPHEIDMFSHRYNWRELVLTEEPCQYQLIHYDPEAMTSSSRHIPLDQI